MLNMIAFDFKISTKEIRKKISKINNYTEQLEYLLLSFWKEKIIEKLTQSTLEKWRKNLRIECTKRTIEILRSGTLKNFKMLKNDGFVIFQLSRDDQSDQQVLSEFPDIKKEYEKQYDTIYINSIQNPEFLVPYMKKKDWKKLRPILDPKNKNLKDEELKSILYSIFQFSIKLTKSSKKSNELIEKIEGSLNQEEIESIYQFISSGEIQNSINEIEKLLEELEIEFFKL